jgi:magnesium-transporting ATPase (P-type)
MTLIPLEVQARLNELGVNPATGLTSAQVAAHRQQYGSNVIDLPEPEPWWKNLLEKFTENPIPILTGAALLSIFLAVFFKHELPIDGLAILAAVILAVGVGFINEFKSGVEYERLKLSRLDVPVTVSRDGKEQKISVNAVVVGDIVHLQTGSKIPADCLLVHGESMEVDQARMTGESVPSVKGAEDVKLYGGTDVVRHRPGAGQQGGQPEPVGRDRPPVARRAGENAARRAPGWPDGYHQQGRHHRRRADLCGFGGRNGGAPSCCMRR